MKSFDTNRAETLVVALGGLGEVGKNMYVIMHDDELIIIDAGVMFPKDELMGIDYVIPDFNFLKKNEDKIKALFITHGHEDHIGCISYLLQTVNVPVIYAPNQACGLIKRKLQDKNISYDNLKVYNENTKINFKHLQVEFFATTHSIPDSHGIIINTPNGKIVETGDFKFDLTPIGPMSNIHKMSDTGKDGVRLLMSESTNALSPGFSVSESKVEEELQEIFEKKKGRIILATFASNIYRLKHIVETCKKNNRKIALFGRSMDTSIDIAIKCGYIKDRKIIISPEEANKLKPESVCLLCTGSQGEPLAALSRIAAGSHKQIKLMPNDVVIFSSNPIPGNEKAVFNVINELEMKGAHVIFQNTHVSGHACQEELKLMYALTKPKYAIPVHGEYRHLKRHAELACEMGVPKENVRILSTGDVLEISDDTFKVTGRVPAQGVLVDGLGVGDVGNIVLRDRQHLSQNGLIIVVVTLEKDSNQLIAGPDIVSRGFLYVRESETLMEDCRAVVQEALDNCLYKNVTDWGKIKNSIKDSLGEFLWKRTKRSPMILPIITEV